MKSPSSYKRLIIFVSLIVLVFSCFHVMYVFRHVNTEVKGYQTRIADMNIQTLKERLHSDTNHLSSLASFLERQPPAFWESEEVALVVNDFRENSNFASIGIADRNGMLHHFSTQVLDISERNYFQFALNGEISLESITANENVTKTDVLNIGIPLQINGIVKGVVVGSYSTENLDNLLPTGLHDAGIHNFIVRNDGAIIINGSDKKTFENIEDLWAYEKCDISETDYMIISKSITNSIKGTITYKINNETHHVISVPVAFTDDYAHIGNIHWNLLVDIPNHFIWDKVLLLLIETIAYTLLLLAMFYLLSFFYYRERNKNFHKKVKELNESENAYALQAEQLLKTEMVSRTDAVTGGFNRIALEQEYEKAARTAQAITVLLADLDNFKQVNDQFGHDAGDHVLKEFSKLLEQILGEGNGFSGRIGGDEFVLCIPNLPKSASQNLAEEIQKKFALKFSEYCIQCNLGVTIGISYMPQHGKGLYELLKYADKALYHGKKLGKGHITTAE